MIPDKYSISNLLAALRDPSLFLIEYRQLAMAGNLTVHRRLSRDGAVDMMAEDWDTLLILDGCRYDTFAERCRLPGELESRTSPGSHSREFLAETFGDGTFHDTVYVTANPYAMRLEEETFHAFVPLVDEWDAELETVPPDQVARAAREAHEEYPHKRLIVHFMQPHYPFIGEMGRTLDHRGHSSDIDDPELDGAFVWERLQHGDEELDADEVRRAYRENLDVVLEHVATLSEVVSGKTVVTADHGNLLGERVYPFPVSAYGHPEGLRSEGVVKVPWFNLLFEVRRSIVAEPPEAHETVADEVVRDRLERLGYR